MRRLCPAPVWTASMLTLFALVAGSAFAQVPARGFPPGLAEARLIKQMPEQIGVGEETLAKLEKLVAEIRAEREAFQSKSMEANQKIRALLDQGRPDEKELMAAAAAAASVGRQMRAHNLAATLRIRALLTDEQLAKFMEVRTKAMERGPRRGRPRVRREAPQQVPEAGAPNDG